MQLYYNAIFLKDVLFTQKFTSIMPDSLLWPDNVSKAGFNFPRAQGHMPLDFAVACGPLEFSDMGPKIVWLINGNPVFDHRFLSKDLFVRPKKN